VGHDLAVHQRAELLEGLAEVVIPRLRAVQTRPASASYGQSGPTDLLLPPPPHPGVQAAAVEPPARARLGECVGGGGCLIGPATRGRPRPLPIPAPVTTSRRSKSGAHPLRCPRPDMRSSPAPLPWRRHVSRGLLPRSHPRCCLRETRDTSWPGAHRRLRLAGDRPPPPDNPDQCV
jgi:hypothetical protein